MLDNLLDSKLKKKVLGIFFALPKRSFSVRELKYAAAGSERAVSTVTRELARAGIVSVSKRKQNRFFRVNRRYTLYQELADMVRKEFDESGDIVAKTLRRLPNARLVVLTGIFTSEPQLSTDILIVGKDVSRIRLQRLLKEVEDLTGQEINYTIFNEDEYEYRRLMNDRFVRDILDNSHIVVLNTLRHRR